MNLSAEPETGSFRPQAAGGDDLPQVLYIMGTGRSGTTVLEILLTNNPGLAGVGEATHIFRDGFIGNDVCSCGLRARSCPVWSAVARRCGWKDDDVEGLAKLFHDVAWHSRFPGLMAGFLPDVQRARYRMVNACLFTAASTLTASPVLVDSSKYAGRALELARLFPEHLRVICLTRSPAGLAAAFAKPDTDEQRPKSLLAVLPYYLYTLACFRIVAWKLGPRLLKVSYEDFMSDPVETLQRIAQWSGLDLGHAIGSLRDDRWLEVGHMVTGNRLRRQWRIKFKPRVPINYQVGMMKQPVIWLMNRYRNISGFQE